MASSKPLCRYHIHGACKEGSNCSFSHDRSLSPSMICRYYQQGMCRYGDRCRYDHVKTHKKSTLTPVFSPEILSAVNKPLPELDSKLDSKKSSEQIPSPNLSVSAKEFFPGVPYQGVGSYAYAVEPNSQKPPDILSSGESKSATSDILCPFIMQGFCPYEEKCEYLHGNQCEFCGLAVLHPTDKKQQSDHIEECQKDIEKDMELSFKVAQSEKKECGICMDIVMQKDPITERRFGILSNCNHVFCLSCIRKWRKEKNFDSKAIRSCPECRVVSDFVTPSEFWVETREEKNALIDGYKQSMRKKPCQYFKKGAGECPFNAHCFYEHAYPDGRIASPKPPRRRRRQDDSEELSLIEHILLWDFFEEHENSLLEALGVDLSEHLLYLSDLHLDSDSSSDIDFEL